MEFCCNEGSALFPGGRSPDLTCSVTPMVRWVRLTDAWSSLMLRKVVKRGHQETVLATGSSELEREGGVGLLV